MNITDIKISALKGFLPIAFFIICNIPGYSTSVGESSNLLVNGSFEKPANFGGAAQLRAKGFDIGPSGSWAEGWTVNSGVGGPGKVRIITGDGAPGGGTRHLQVEGPAHVYTSGGKSGVTYHWSLWAKGELLPGASEQRPILAVVTYEYGILDELTGRQGFLGSHGHAASPRNLVLSSEWKRYEGTVSTQRENAKEFSFVLAFPQGSRISVDDVVLTREVSDSFKEPRVFYLPFDKGLDAVESVGKGRADAVGKVTLTDGKEGRGGLFISNAHLVFDTGRNFNQNEGTLSMWVKPFWDKDDGQAHCFFEAPVPPYFWTDSGFFLTKGFDGQIAPNSFYFGSCPPWTSISPGIPFQEGQWIHLTFSWSQSAGILRAYVNGKLVEEKKGSLSKYPGSEGRKMIIGARMGGKTPTPSEPVPVEQGNKARDLPESGAYSADAVIDELQIFNRLLTHQEVWQLSGGEGPVPEAKKELLAPESLTVLTHNLITPHVPFAKPLEGGPVKTMFCIPGGVARDVVELWQRFDIDDNAFIVLGDPNRAVSWYDAGSYALKNFRGILKEELEKGLLSKLDANPEVIVLASADLNKASSAARNRIIELVKGGAGLVMTYYAIPSGGRFFEKEDPEGRAFICAGVPWSGLPELFPGEGVSVSDLPSKSVATYRYGKGRVVAVRFRAEPIKQRGNIRYADGLAPCLFGIGYTREWDDRYGRYLSLIARSILWASGRERQWTLGMPGDGSCFQRKDLPKEAAFNFKITSAVPGAGILSVEIRDPLGNVKFTDRLKVEIKDAGKSEVLNLAVPMLETGLHYLDAKFLIEDKTADWGSAAFLITAPEEIVSINLERDTVERGEQLSGAVSLREAPDKPVQLHVRVIDANDRVYAEIDREIPAGEKSVPFAIVLDDPTTIASYIEAQVISGGEVISRKSSVAYVPKRNMEALDAHEFPHVVWGSCGVNAAGMVEARQWRKAGFNIGLAWPRDTVARNMAMGDMAMVAYVTRLLIPTAVNGAPPAPEGIKDGSFANPAIKEHKWQGVQGNLLDVKKYGPFFYSLGDENFFYGEFGYSPWGIKAYRRYLSDRYGSIERLNQEWKAHYKSFEEVPRLSPTEARTERNVSAMIDHRSAQEMVWREMHVFLADRIKSQYDPRAKVGAEGSATRDLEAMVEALDVWAPYSGVRGDVLGRCVAKPGAISGHWHGSYLKHDQIPAMAATRLWGQLFRGFATAGFYYSGGIKDGLLMADYSYNDFFKTQLPDLELIHGGIGQLLRTCHVKPSGAAIHWSQASRFGLEAADEFGKPEETDGVLISILKKQGIVNWDYVTGRQLENNPELAMNQQVIFLPVSQCISEKEVRTLVGFVKKGGLLVGIGPAGSRSEYGRELDAGRLDDVFGVRMSAPSRVKDLDGLDTRFAWKDGMTLPVKTRPGNNGNAAVVATTGRVLVEFSGIPVVVHNRLGKGETLLLNLNLARNDRQSASDLIAGLLDGAGVSTPVRFLPEPGPIASEGAGGLEMSGAVRSRYGLLEKGDLTLLGVIMNHLAGQWNGGKVILPEAKHVYDVKAGKYLGKLKEIEVAGRNDVQSAALFALQKERIKAVKLTAPKAAERGQPVTIACEVRAKGDFSCEGRVVRIKLCGPDGEKRVHYRRMAHLDKNGWGRASVQFAFNDPTGPWNVIATDIASGVNATAKLVLK